MVFLEAADAAFHYFGLLKTQLVGQRKHLVLHLLHNVGEIAFENVTDAVDVGHVLFVRLQPGARCLAETYLVFDAGFLLHLVAFAVRKEIVDDVLQFAQDALVGVGAEILPFDIAVSGEEQARVFLIGDAEVGVGLVVLEHTVVAWLVAFDEVVLQQKGVDLGGHHRDADVVDVAHQHLDFSALVLVMGEVGTDASLQVAGLAHINNRPRFVEVLVHSGVLGDGLQPQGYAVDILVD